MEGRVTLTEQGGQQSSANSQAAGKETNLILDSVLFHLDDLIGGT